MQRQNDSAIHEFVIQKNLVIQVFFKKRNSFWNQTHLMGNCKASFYTYIRKNRHDFAWKMRHVIFRQWGGNYRHAQLPKNKPLCNMNFSKVIEHVCIFKYGLSKKKVPTLIIHCSLFKWLEIRKSYCQEFTIQKS